MSYGDVYIQSDMKKLEAEGYSKADIDKIIAKRIRNRYPNISLKQARTIVHNIRKYGMGKWDEVLHKRTVYTADEIGPWSRRKNPGIDEQKNEFRYRVCEPSKFGNFRARTFGKGVYGIFACPKGKWRSGKCVTTLPIQSLRFRKTHFTSKGEVREWLKKHKDLITCRRAHKRIRNNPLSTKKQFEIIGDYVMDAARRYYDSALTPMSSNQPSVYLSQAVGAFRMLDTYETDELLKIAPLVYHIASSDSLAPKYSDVKDPVAQLKSEIERIHLYSKKANPKVRSNSTRVTIEIIDSNGESIHFYRHSYGYPAGILPTLRLFLKWVKEGKIRDNAQQSAGWLVMIGNREYHKKDKNYWQPINDWQVGAYEPTVKGERHLDRQYHYVIDLSKKQITVHDFGSDKVYVDEGAEVAKLNPQYKVAIYVSKAKSNEVKKIIETNMHVPSIILAEGLSRNTKFTDKEQDELDDAYQDFGQEVNKILRAHGYEMGFYLPDNTTIKHGILNLVYEAYPIIHLQKNPISKEEIVENIITGIKLAIREHRLLRGDIAEQNRNYAIGSYAALSISERDEFNNRCPHALKLMVIPESDWHTHLGSSTLTTAEYELGQVEKTKNPPEGVASSIQTMHGEAYYLKTEVENAQGRWNDSYYTLAGEYVIHDGPRHHVYVVRRKNPKSEKQIVAMINEQLAMINDAWSLGEKRRAHVLFRICQGYMNALKHDEWERSGLKNEYETWKKTIVEWETEHMKVNPKRKQVRLEDGMQVTYVEMSYPQFREGMRCENLLTRYDTGTIVKQWNLDNRMDIYTDKTRRRVYVMWNNVQVGLCPVDRVNLSTTTIARRESPYEVHKKNFINRVIHSQDKMSGVRLFLKLNSEYMLTKQDLETIIDRSKIPQVVKIARRKLTMIRENPRSVKWVTERIIDNVIDAINTGGESGKVYLREARSLRRALTEVERTKFTNDYPVINRAVGTLVIDYPSSLHSEITNLRGMGWSVKTSSNPRKYAWAIYRKGTKFNRYLGARLPNQYIPIYGTESFAEKRSKEEFGKKGAKLIINSTMRKQILARYRGYGIKKFRKTKNPVDKFNWKVDVPKISWGFTPEGGVYRCSKCGSVNIKPGTCPRCHRKLVKDNPAITYSKPRKNEYSEWEAKAYKDGKRYPDADIFESTKEDLLNTMKSEMSRQPIQGNLSFGDIGNSLKSIGSKIGKAAVSVGKKVGHATIEASKKAGSYALKQSKAAMKLAAHKSSQAAKSAISKSMRAAGEGMHSIANRISPASINAGTLDPNDKVTLHWKCMKCGRGLTNNDLISTKVKNDLVCPYCRGSFKKYGLDTWREKRKRSHLTSDQKFDKLLDEQYSDDEYQFYADNPFIVIAVAKLAHKKKMTENEAMNWINEEYGSLRDFLAGDSPALLDKIYDVYYGKQIKSSMRKEDLHAIRRQHDIDDNPTMRCKYDDSILELIDTDSRQEWVDETYKCKECSRTYSNKIWYDQRGNVTHNDFELVE